MWDYGSGRLIETLPWFRSEMHTNQSCMLYAAQFDKTGNFAVGGGSGANEGKV
jgi:hypothetical protein